MHRISYLTVSDEKSVRLVASLAQEIWTEYYIPLVGQAQVEYMLHQFQSKEAISKQISEGFSYYLLKDEKDEYVGYLAFVPKENELFLSKIYIRAKNRRKGYGRQTIDFIEKIAQKNNLHKITLTVNKKNKNSIQAYEKFGFVIRESIIQEIGNGFVMDDYRMEKAV